MVGLLLSLARVKHLSAIVLCGGLGTRLRAAVPDLPKCLAPVAGRPFLAYLLGWLAAWKVTDVVLAVGHGAAAVRQVIGDGATYGVSVRYSQEPVPLGTGGAVRQAARLFAAVEFLVLNGDTFLTVDLAGLVARHRRSDALVTMAVVRPPGEARYGFVQLDPAGRVTAFREKAEGAMDAWVSGGVYAFRRAALEHIPAGSPVSLETDVFPTLARRALAAHPVDGYFLDIGTPAAYARAQRELPALLGAC